MPAQSGFLSYGLGWMTNPKTSCWGVLSFTLLDAPHTQTAKLYPWPTIENNRERWGIKNNHPRRKTPTLDAVGAANACDT